MPESLILRLILMLLLVLRAGNNGQQARQTQMESSLENIRTLARELKAPPGFPSLTK